MPSSPINVLLIEDNEDDYIRTCRLLRQAKNCDFSMTWADSFAEGKAQLTKSPRDADVILLDLALPDSKGWDTFDSVKQVASDIPIVLFTGYSDEQTAVEAVQKGAQDYLIKNQVDGHVLSRSVQYAIERKNAQLQLQRYTEQLSERNAELSDELNMAREIQEALLPQEDPKFPQLSQSKQVIRFSHLYHPSMAVGGDFFDIKPISEKQAGVFLCDVMGHGLRAALVTAIIRGELEEHSDLAMSPGAFLTRINQKLKAIFSRTNQLIFASALYMVVDVSDGTLQVANAGHTPPLHIDRRDGTVDFLVSDSDIKGPALGLFEDSAYSVCKCGIGPDQLAFLFTDGLYDVGGDLGEKQGQQPLLDALQERTHMSTDAMFQDLLTALGNPSESIEDDVCILGLEYVA